MTKTSVRSKGCPRPLTAGLALALFLLASLAPAVGQRSRETFQDTTTVTLVEVPVQVVRDGDPLTGLTKENFELFEGKKKQEIVAFEMVDLTVTEGPNADMPVAARRHFLILFDLSTVDPQAVDKAQAAARQLVLEALHPSDLVALATYTRNKGMNLVLGFTPDRNQVDQAISTLGFFTEVQTRMNDPLGLVIGDIDSTAAAESASAVGFSGQAELEAQRADLRQLNDRDRQDQAKNDLAALTRSLEAVANMMGAVDGRKHVLFLSAGFDSSLLVGNMGVSNEDRERQEELARAVQDGQTWKVRNEEIYGSGEAQSLLRQMATAFQQNDCMIQAIDIGGLVAGRQNRAQDGLFYMANETGGEMFSNYNNLGEAMGEMLQRTSVTYLLAFSPKDLKYDGEFRKINVKLKNAPRGARITHRPGYMPPKPFEQQSGFEKRMQVAQDVAGGRAGGAIGVHVLSTPIYMGSEKSYVPLMIEIPGSDLMRSQADGVLNAEIYAYAQDAEGAVRDFFVRGVPLDMAKAKAQLAAGGLKYYGHLDLNPGEYTLRVLVRNGASGAQGLEVVSLHVPAVDDGAAALLAPLVPEQPGKWVMDREEEAEQRSGVDFPYQFDDQFFIPAVKPIVQPGTELAMYLFGYNLGEGSLSATAQLLDWEGQSYPAEITLQDASNSEGGLARVPAVIKAGQLGAGDYTLVVTVKDLASNAQSTSSLGVTVGG